MLPTLRLAEIETGPKKTQTDTSFLKEDCSVDDVSLTVEFLSQNDIGTDPNYLGDDYLKA